MKTLKLRPIGGRVLIRPDEQVAKTAGGIFIPDAAKEKPQEGVVVELGTGRTDENGKKVPFDVQVGDRVTFGKYGAVEIKIDGVVHVIVSEEEIMGVGV